MKIFKISIYYSIVLSIGILLNSCASLTVPGLSGLDKTAENLIIGKFVSNFKQNTPISTSINDAYKQAAGIPDFPPKPVSRKMMDDLKQNGKVFLNPGVYDFYLQSFCLHAGKYAPKSTGTGYLVARLKGAQAQVIKDLMSNYAKYPEIQQSQVQTLI